MAAKCFSNQAVALKVINDGGVYVNHKKLGNPHAILVFGVHILSNMITVLRVGTSMIDRRCISLDMFVSSSREEKFLHDSMDEFRCLIWIFFFLL